MDLMVEAQELSMYQPIVLQEIPLEVSVPLEPEQLQHLQNEMPQIEICVSELPGAPDNTQIEEKEGEPLEVSLSDEKESKEDENDNKEEGRWDWSKRDLNNFVGWVEEKLSQVPKHSGYSPNGLHRAVAFLEKLNTEISKAMRSDLDAVLDDATIEKIRNDIEQGIQRLEERLEKVTQKDKKSKKKRAEVNPEFLKNAQKIFGVQSGIVVQVPLLIAAIGRICANSMISAGHDIEDTYEQLSKKFKLNDREKFELRMFLFDMGLPIKIDRGLEPEEELNFANETNFDFAANYSA